MHDARVFRLCPLYERLMDVDNPLLDENKHIIGDVAYPLSVNLMKPYSDNGHLNNLQQTFNIKLASVRSTIERAFGLVKVKFRRLKYVDVASAETASRIVGAACVLHNFIIQQNNNEDDYDVELDEEDEEGDNEHDEVAENIRGGAAENKRQRLANICAQI